jgi:hypothetical protein
MNKFFVLICSIILLPFSESQIKPKLCINCKFFKNYFLNSKYGKCEMFITTYDNDYFLVNGNKNKIDFAFCSTARKFEDMCGEQGKFYEKK